MRTPSPPQADQRGKAPAQSKNPPVKKPWTAKEQIKQAKWYAKCNRRKFQQKMAAAKQAKDREKLEKEQAQAEVSKLLDIIAQYESDSHTVDQQDQEDIDRKDVFTRYKMEMWQFPGITLTHLLNIGVSLHGVTPLI